MKVTRIDFDDEGDPQEVTLIANINELNLINRLLSELSPRAINAIVPHHSDEQETITRTLDSMVYCRYWEDGLDGAIPRSPIRINDIVLLAVQKGEVNGG